MTEPSYELLAGHGARTHLEQLVELYAEVYAEPPYLEGPGHVASFRRHVTREVDLPGFALALALQRDDQVSASSVDVGFLQDMDYHHDQAVEMAELQLMNGESPDVDHLAREVLLVQAFEMGSMQRTLEEWGYSTYDEHRPPEAMAWMGMPVPVAQMPGLQSEEQMAELGEAEGSEADALFMEMMVDHHVGGLHMAEYAARNAGTEFVRDLAAAMAENQAKEINAYAGVAERSGLPVEIDLVPVPNFDSAG
jgi:uncharacterized protein (DUF305 family)